MMQKKKIEELNVLDDFLFGKLVSHPSIGPTFCKKLLSIVLKKEIGNVHIIPQKVYYGTETNKHGIRLDVYIQECSETGTETIYDVEPDQNNRTEMKVALPKRVRFYHAKIDADSLASGDGYSQLKRVIVIMICPYDPLGGNRMVYTIKNSCLEDPEIPYDDGACTIFLYTNGTVGNPPEELQKLLHYLEKSNAENANSEVLKEIHDMVQTVKHDKEVSIEYMKIFEREQLIREDGREDGRAEGQAKLIEIIRKKHAKNLSSQEIAEILELDETYVREIVALLETNSEEDDFEIAKTMLHLV